ncbi:ATP-binding response regulator [Paraburkholderia atlantica]|uniref:histidine kinase n=1 Tax=Paraburkholderia atlantica TaxID=2654982 RepID=D5WNI7_PARAM|nr:hybrid sensor histidine kinase/response regulator [Paraburkholderia atlantica]ADG20866.1 integral membrane sensor hybrid histidine kinase [Paraburkholderia atlantica]MBB5510919.1 signal transduction histidine kinase [Paraburkholderia atlantica]
MVRNEVAVTVTRIATIVALILTVALPWGYFEVAYGALESQTETEAQIRAGFLSQFIGANPELWAFYEHNLHEALSRDPPLRSEQFNRIQNLNRQVVASAGEPPSWPQIVRTVELYDAGKLTGYLEVTRSMRAVVRNTVAVGLLGLMLGVAVFFVLRVLPLRALQHVTEALEREIEKHVEARREAEAANRAKSQFLAAASHDLRQPLHALGLFAAGLTSAVREPSVLGIVAKINDCTETLEELFNELLDLSKLDAGIIQPVLNHFPIEALFRRLRAEYEPMAMEKGIALKITSSKAQVFSDTILLEQILRNLISNAIRYTPCGGRVLVGCRRRGQKLRVEVWDTGIGIPADETERIFEEFYQIGNPERDRRKGLGLGLAIVKRTAKLLGSDVHVASKRESGSVFSFDIPSGHARLSTSKESIPRVEVSRSAVKGSLIAVVDDELEILDGMRNLLVQWGCEAVCTATLEEAAQELVHHGRRPDAFLVDYRLREGVSGVSVIRNLQARFGTDIPAVLITGETAPESLREVNESGYQQIHKPLPPARLYDMLSGLIKSKQDEHGPP